jgi:hypothetical protein
MTVSQRGPPCDDLILMHPFSCLVRGPIGSSISSFCIRFLHHLDTVPNVHLTVVSSGAIASGAPFSLCSWPGRNTFVLTGDCLPSVASAFRSIFQDDSRRLPVWVHTDKGKEFLNKLFQHMLRVEGIQFQVCKNPDVKCAVVERAHRMILDSLQILYV